MDGEAMTHTQSPKNRTTYLSVTDIYNLEMACRVLTMAFGLHTYQVGSSLQRPDYRDVDLRCILPDEEFDQMFFGNAHKLQLMNVALSEWIAARTGLPIDFQFQHRSDANAEFDGPRYCRGMMKRSEISKMEESE